MFNSFSIKAFANVNDF